MRSVDSSFTGDYFGVFVSTSSNTDLSTFTEVQSWTNPDGSWNEYSVDLSSYSGSGYIAIRHYNSEDQYIISLDEVVIDSYIHQFVYSAEGAEITATCEKEKCNLTDHKVSFSIEAPAKTLQGDDLSSDAVLSGVDAFNSKTKHSVGPEDIVYEGTGSTEYPQSSTAPTDAGTYIASVTVEGVTASVEYTIIGTDPSVAAAPAANDLTYNGASQALVTAGVPENGTMYYAVTAENAEPSADLYAEEVPSGIAAGTYYVWYKVVGGINNTETPVECVIVEIAPAPLTITAEDKQKTEGAADPELTYTAEGLLDGDVITGSLVRAEGENPGSYDITIGTVSASENYTVTFVSGKLTINKKAEEKHTTPDTGDRSNIGGWASASLFSLIIAIFATLTLKRHA